MEDDQLVISIKLYDRVYKFRIDRNEEEAFRKAKTLFDDRFQVFFSALEANISNGELSREDVLYLLAYEFAVKNADMKITEDLDIKKLKEIVDMK